MIWIDECMYRCCFGRSSVPSRLSVLPSPPVKPGKVSDWLGCGVSRLSSPNSSGTIAYFSAHVCAKHASLFFQTCLRVCMCACVPRTKVTRSKRVISYSRSYWTSNYRGLRDKRAILRDVHNHFGPKSQPSNYIFGGAWQRSIPGGPFSDIILRTVTSPRAWIIIG